MKQDVRTRGEDKRQAVLNAARLVFLRDGFSAASMDEIARAARVSKQTVYAHFGTKKDLFVDLVTDMSVAPRAKGNDLVPAKDRAELERNLGEFAERQLGLVLAPELMQLRRLLIGEATRFPELAAALHEQWPQSAITVLSREMARLAQKGMLEIDDSRAAAMDFCWLVMGEPVNRALLLGDEAVPSARALRAHAERAVEVFLEAYGRQ